MTAILEHLVAAASIGAVLAAGCWFIYEGARWYRVDRCRLSVRWLLVLTALAAFLLWGLQ